MNFQSQVNINLALGKEGTISRLNPLTSLPMVAEADVKAGGFVFEGTNPELQVVGIKAGATSVKGFAVFENMQANYTGTNTMSVNDGENVQVVLKGWCYARPTTASVNGQSVYVNPTTGEIQTASSKPENFIDTGWKVETGNGANQVCEIYNI